MIVELRTYQTKPGMRDRFLQLFGELTLPEHERLGISISGPFLSVFEPDRFFFMRGFPDLESRDRLKGEFYGGSLWKERLEALLLPMLDRYEEELIGDPGRLLAWNPPTRAPITEDAR
jgi:hypothetical protein